MMQTECVQNIMIASQFASFFQYSPGTTWTKIILRTYTHRRCLENHSVSLEEYAHVNATTRKKR